MNFPESITILNNKPGTCLKMLLLALCFLTPLPVQAESSGTYELSLSFAPEKNELTGTAKITVPPGRELQLYLGRLRISGSLLKTEDGTENILSIQEDTITLAAHPKQRVLFLSYSCSTGDSGDNVISPEGIALTGVWFPLPAKPMLFDISAEIPAHFTAIVEADNFPLTRNGNTVRAVYSRPATALHFVAGPYITDRVEVRDNFYVYTMFFRKDKALASLYLENARKYILKYEDQIGPFPYNHYAIVANRMPTGYGMPTFTLLGRMLLPLPFISEGSLSHEIVHSWFGNSIEVDLSSGNWCEGLTAYLSDQQLQEERGEGAAYRKEAITKYLNYAGTAAPITLAQFTSASHDQPTAETVRAVGYNRGLMLFSELRERLGADLFRKGLQHFYEHNRFSRASWEDIRESFESVSGAGLRLFFRERLTRNDIPRLGIKNVGVSYSGSAPVLNFDLSQETEQPFSLTVPIHVTTSSGTTETTREITSLDTRVTVELTERPAMITLDPELTFLRELSAKERVPVWSQFLGSDKKLVILAAEQDREKYDALLGRLDNYSLKTATSGEITNAELAGGDLLFLGASGAPFRSLFGRVDHPAGGITLEVRPNPLNRDHVAVLVTASSEKEVADAAGKLSHYAKYSYLEFSGGRNLKKSMTAAQDGIRFIIEQLPQGSGTRNISSFDQIVEELAGNRVVYVGENHTALGDHLLQLRIIEALHAKHPKLAIGMEMFPKSSQPALDAYTRQNSSMPELEFLVESEYYDVWRYDYRLYRDILNFARNNAVPVVALNVDRNIVSRVFRDGNTDGLAPEILSNLPEERDLSLPGYAERLDAMFSVHTVGGHAAGQQSGFIQAQAIWDESMAENVAQFATAFPDHTMVVLAGAQHTRKDSGIPPRVARRVGVKQASVLNVYSSSGSENLAGIADYYFFSQYEELPEKPRIGIVLNTPDSKENEKRLVIEQLSPHGKAGEAGLLIGDVLVKVKGVPVSSMAGLQAIMLDSRAGDTITVEVLRETGQITQNLTFTVELTGDRPPEGHP
jgi:aminopeptidase N